MLRHIVIHCSKAHTAPSVTEKSDKSNEKKDGIHIADIDYKNIPFLTNYIMETGRIIPAEYQTQQ